MISYNATYTISGSAQPATVLLLKDKIAIRLYTRDGEKLVYWFYTALSQNENLPALFTYTAYPPQALEILDKTLVEKLVWQAAISKKAHLQKRNRVAAAIITGCIALAGFVYFFILPWSAAALAARVPVAYEKKLGAQLFAAMKGDFSIDEKRSLYATEFFDALQIPSAYAIKITVVKSKVANAFALPGGHIVIYDGLLNNLSSYPELAALLAHEFIHIENRHSLKSLFRQASTTLLFSTLMGDAGALGSTVLSSANQLKDLSYSRSLEREADTDGLALVTTRKIDGTGFIRLFRILQNEPATKQPEWISSHPNLDKRIKNIQQQPAFKQQDPVTDATLQTLFQKLKSGE